MVHAEDVARAALHLLPLEEAAGEVYNVSDGDEMTLGARLGITFDAYGLTTVSLGDAPEALYRLLGKLFQQPGAHQGADAALATPAEAVRFDMRRSQAGTRCAASSARMWVALRLAPRAHRFLVLLEPTEAATPRRRFDPRRSSASRGRPGA